MCKDNILYILYIVVERRYVTWDQNKVTHSLKNTSAVDETILRVPS